MHPDLVVAIFRQRMTALTREARARRIGRAASQMAKGSRPLAKRSAITSSVTQ
jgi:hypothetical protein